MRDIAAMFGRLLSVVLVLAALAAAAIGHAAPTPDGYPYFRWGNGGPFGQGTALLRISATLPNGTVGVPYSASASAGGGEKPYSFAINTALPAGLVFDQATGAITGVPTTEGTTYGIIISVTDNAGTTAVTPPMQLTILPASTPHELTISATFPTGNVGKTYSMTPTAGGGTGPYVFSVNKTLQPGLVFNPATGSITGSPTVASIVAGVVITVTDARGATASTAPQNLTIQDGISLDQTTIWSAADQNPILGQSYRSSASFVASGGIQPYTFTFGGTPPAGIAWVQDSPTTWHLEGTPTALGPSSLTITVTDVAGWSSSISAIPIYVNAPLAIGNFTGAAATTTRTPYSGAVAASGGRAPYNFTLYGGALPAGINLNRSSGLVSGSALVGGNFGPYTIEVTDVAGRTATSAPFSLSVSDPIVVGGGVSAVLGLGEPYSDTFGVTGGTSPYSWSIANKPAGLTFTPSGAAAELSGAPSSAGKSTVVVTAQDSMGRQASRSFTLSVMGNVSVSGNPPATATVGSNYTASFSGIGGAAPYNYQLTGSLPPGLAFDSTTGVINGAPTAGGDYGPFVVKATDVLNEVGYSAPFTIAVDRPLSISGTPPGAGTTGSVLSSSWTASGGRGGYTFSIAGALPPGVTINASTGLIYGTPTASGSFTAKVNVADGAGHNGSGPEFTVVVSDPLVLSGGADFSGYIGNAYAAEFTATGGRTPLTFTFGPLPSSITATTDTRSASLSGTSAVPMAFTLQPRVTDADGRTATAGPFAIGFAGPLTISQQQPPAATQSVEYSASFPAFGGWGPYSYSLTGPALPAGLALDTSTGVIAGVPSAAGNYGSYTITATDARGATAAKSFGLLVQAVGTLTASGTPASTATVGSTYSFNFSRGGGVGPYSWSLASGSLPPGLSLDPASGEITGVPASSGTYTAAVRITDSRPVSADTASFTIDVRDPVTIAAPALGSGTTGAAYGPFSIDVAGGRPPYQVSLASGTLPTGVTVGAAGAIAGVPTQAGTFTPSFAARDADGRLATSTAVTFSIYGTPALSYEDGAANIDTAFNLSPAVAGGHEPYAFSLVDGALPPGLTLNAATGAITGSPSQIGTFGATIKVADADGRNKSATVSIAVTYPPIALTGSPATWTTVGSPYAAQFSAAGGTGSFVYAMSGTLPSWMAFDPATGSITGTPDAAGTYGPYSVTAADAQGTTATSPVFSIAVADPLTLTASLPAGLTATPYDGIFSAAGGSVPISYAITSGTLPLGLSFGTSSGRITGTVSTDATTGSYPLAAKATDIHGRTATASGSINIGVSPLSYSYAPVVGTVGTAITAPASITGGRTPYAFGPVDGSPLPPGLVLNQSTGAVTGTPQLSGTTTVALAAIDYVGQQATAFLTISVDPLPLSITGAPAGWATVGTPYSASYVAKGGVGPYSFALTGDLPPGMTFDPSSGTIAGAASTAGNYGPFTVSVTDAVSSTKAAAAFSIAVADTMQVAASLPDGLTGADYTGGFSATGGTGPYSYVLTGDLPPGLSFSGSTGQITGTISASSDIKGYPLSVTATDAHGRTADASGTLTTTISPVVLSYAPKAVGTVGKPLAVTANTTGGRTPYTFEVSNGALPSGLDLEATSGKITGTPMQPGDAVVTVTAVDAVPQTASASLTVAVKPAVEVTATMPTGIAGRAYVGQVSATGGAGDYTFSVVSGALPAGLVLDAPSGAITGAADAGSYSIAIKATDSEGRSATTDAIAFTITPALSVNASPSPVGTVGKVYSAVFAGAGGKPPYTYSLSGTPPSGMALDTSTGILSGAPSDVGTWDNLTVTVTDAESYTAATPPFSITVAQPVVVTGNVPGGAAGFDFTANFSATGGKSPYTWSLSGALPGGLAFNATTATITGKPIAGSAGSYPITVTATDAAGRTGVITPTIAINQGLTLSFDGAWPDMNGITVGTAVPADLPAFTITGGAAPYSLVVDSGTLPSGVTIENTSPTSARLKGTFTTTGYFPAFTMRVTDALSATATLTSPDFVVYANPVLSYALQAYARIGQAYNVTRNLAGGHAPFVYTLVSGTIPDGLSLNQSTGMISGTPNAGSAGSYTLSVKVTDVDGRTATATLPTITVVDPLVLTLDGAWPVNGVLTLGVPYTSPHVTASGGLPPYSFDIASGSPAPGTGLSGSADYRVLTGTPNTSGTYAGFTLRVTDNLGSTATLATPSFVVYGAPTLSYASSPATKGSAYSLTPTVAGGHAPVSYAVTSGALPDGLVIDPASGAITGSPTTLGTASVTITATDADGRIGTGSATITVADPVVVSGTALSPGVVGRTYTSLFTATGGNGTYVWSLGSGILPNGLSIVPSSGALNGTPSQTGAFTFTLKATDGAGRIGLSASQSVTVAPALTVNGTLPAGSVGTVYGGQITASGGSGGYVYSVATGALPAGLDLDPATGHIAGSPTTSGTFAVTFRVTDSQNGTATAPFSVVITPAVVVAGAPSLAKTRLPYTTTFTASGGSGAPYSFTLSGALPDGLAFNTATASISGTAVGGSAGTYPITVTAADPQGRTGSLAVNLDVEEGFLLNQQGVWTAANTTGVIGSPYSGSPIFSVNGGSAPYTFRVTSGTLPPGLDFVAQPDGLSASIVGTPTEVGAFAGATLQAVDSTGAVANIMASSFTIYPSLSISGAPGTDVVVGALYSAQFTAHGGHTPYSYSSGSQALPAWLAIDSNGLLSGTPTPENAGSFTMTIKVTDADGRVVETPAFTVTATNPITVSGSPPTSAIVGTPYSASFSAAGGQAPYQYSLGSGTLPGWLTLNPATGTVTGTPTAAGVAGPIKILASDATGAYSYSAPFSINIAQAVAVTASPPGGAVGEAYSYTPTASGGSGGFTWSVIDTSGTLSARGLVFDSATGKISGAPTSPGTWSGKLRATDNGGRFADSPPLSITIASTLAWGSGTPSSPTYVGDAYPTFTPNVTGGGPGAKSYSMQTTSGTLASGLSFSSTTGSITGSATSTGNWTGTITVTNGSASAVSPSFNVIAASALSISGSPITSATTGDPYTTTFSSSGGSGVYNWTATGTLPPGLTLSGSGSSRTLSGTPTTAGNYTGLSVTVSDSAGHSKSISFSINVAQGINECTWTTPTTGGAPSGNLGVLSMSGDGKNILAGSTTGGYLYISNNGVWTTQYGPQVKAWRGATLSSDGVYAFAVASDGTLFRMTGGSNWTPLTTPTSGFATTGAMSLDGSRVIFAGTGGKLWTASGGNIASSTWTLTNVSLNWTVSAISADGSHWISGAQNSFVYGSSTGSASGWSIESGLSSGAWGQVALSSNGTKGVISDKSGSVYLLSGSSWNPVATSKLPAGTWTGVAISADGTRILAANSGDYVYVSQDSGVSWKKQTSLGTGTFVAAAMSADGSKVAVSRSSGNISVGTCN